MIVLLVVLVSVFVCVAVSVKSVEWTKTVVTWTLGGTTVLVVVKIVVVHAVMVEGSAVTVAVFFAVCVFVSVVMPKAISVHETVSGNLFFLPGSAWSIGRSVVGGGLARASKRIAASAMRFLKPGKPKPEATGIKPGEVGTVVVGVVVV